MVEPEPGIYAGFHGDSVVYAVCENKIVNFLLIYTRYVVNGLNFWRWD